MRRQIEGPAAVAEPSPRCRPAGGLRLPDHAADPHRRGASAPWCAPATLAPCEFVNVESEFAAMSVAIGASAPGARAYTATASQGLLYMSEALYNASGLGLPIVMTVANRAIGAPINIWNDHSDAMSQRDSGWIQLYAETNQEAIDLHVQAFRLAEELSLPVMVCMDGFVLTHAVEPLEVPAQAAGRRVPAAVRAAPGARPRRAGDDRRHGRPGGVHRGRATSRLPTPAARRCDASRRSPPSSRRVRARLGRAAAHATACEGARDDRRSRWARCSARSRTPSTSCATRACAVGVRRDHLVPPLPASRRCATRSAAPSAWSCSSGPSRSASAASCRPTCAWPSPGCPQRYYTVIAGLGGRPITRARCAG